MSLKKKILVHVAAAAVLIMLMFTLFSEELSGDELVAVSTVTAQRGTFYEDITFSGSVDYGVKTIVEAPFFLEIDKVLLPVGTLVSEGDAVASCAGFQVEKSLLQMEASLQIMKVEVSDLNSKLDNMTGEEEKRPTEIQIRLKEIALEEAEAKYAAVTVCFNEDYDLIATSEGKLTVQNLAAGRQLTTGDVLYEIADADTLEAVFTSPASQEQYVKAGDKITVEVNVYKLGENLDWVSERQALKLEVVAKNTEGGITTYKAAIAPGRNERIDPQQLQANLTREVATYSRLLPHGCIQRDMGSSYIYVVTTNRNLFTVEHYLQKIEVNVMDSNEYYTAVSGETLTDFNIVYTADGALKDGQRVRLAE